MQKGVRIAIDRVEDDPEYEERHSQWTTRMYRNMRNFVRKAGMVKIIVKETGNKYKVVVGHRLLKAARECGLREVYVYVIDTGAEAGKGSLEEALPAFRRGIEEVLHRAAAHPVDGVLSGRLPPPPRRYRPRPERRRETNKTREMRKGGRHKTDRRLPGI